MGGGTGGSSAGDRQPGGWSRSAGGSGSRAGQGRPAEARERSAAASGGGLGQAQVGLPAGPGLSAPGRGAPDLGEYRSRWTSCKAGGTRGGRQAAGAGPCCLRTLADTHAAPDRNSVTLLYASGSPTKTAQDVIDPACPAGLDAAGTG